ncbi:MAG: transposase [Phycisphaerae bacterium]|nr:transposase [Phycisphaerae bacterium]
MRIQFPGALYHVMSRGNEKRPIVRDDIDRAKRVDWLRRTVEIYGWRLHAFALMTNHEHLFVETPEPNLSAGMQYLGGSYTSYFNWRYKRSGHLFQGRFKAHLVQSEGYFREVSRYIHLNPVRAGIVTRPQDYQWSSYSGYAQARRAVAWVYYDRVLAEFGRDLRGARRAYGRFVRAGIDTPPPSPFAKTVGGLLVGSEVFVAKMRRMLQDRPGDAGLPQLREMQSHLRPRPELHRIIALVAEQFGHDPADWCAGKRVNDASRALAAYLARRCFGYSGNQVAAALGYRGHGGVVNAIARIESGGLAIKQTAKEIERELMGSERH